MDFTQLVLTARPNIKPNSAKTYATSLKLLAPADAESPALDFLKDTATVLGKLEKYKMSTKRNYLNAIVIVLKEVEGYEVPLKEYENLRDSYNDELSQETQLHKKSDRQKEIWIEWPDYLFIVEHLRDRVSSLKSGDWTPKQKQDYQDFLITLLYSKYSRLGGRYGDHQDGLQRPHRGPEKSGQLPRQAQHQQVLLRPQ